MQVLRSLLYVPGSRSEMLAKVPDLSADALVVDLEDAVAPQEKELARNRVREAHERGSFEARRPWMLRINPPGTHWHDDDVALAESLSPTLVVIPKCEDPDVVSGLAARFSAHDSSTALMIETARGVAAAQALAVCHPRVEVLVVGSADLRRSLGGRPDPERAWERHALSEILLAARVGECLAVDGVYFLFRDGDGLRRHARVARDLGYDGKSCIHPLQIPIVHQVFSSDPEEIRWARSVLKAWRVGHGERRGVLAHEGEMIEALHLTMARRILARSPLGPDPDSD